VSVFCFLEKWRGELFGRGCFVVDGFVEFVWGVWGLESGDFFGGGGGVLGGGLMVWVLFVLEESVWCFWCGRGGFFGFGSWWGARVFFSPAG